MSQATFAARLNIATKQLRFMESGAQHPDRDVLKRLSDLATLFCADADALKVAITLEGLPVLDVLFCSRQPLGFEQLNDTLERLVLNGSVRGCFSVVTLAGMVLQLSKFGVVSLAYRKNCWKGMSSISQITLTPKGERLLTDNGAIRRSCRCGKAAA